MNGGDRLPLHPVRILSAPFGTVVIVRFLGPIQGLPTHYHAKHTIACEGDENCPPAAHKLRQIWKYYGPVEYWLNSHASWRPACLEASEHLEEVLHGRELRGEVWMLTREGDSVKHSVQTGTFCERLSDAQVSPWFDVEPILLRFFRVKKLLLGFQSPVPRRLFLSDAAGRPPRIPEDLLPPPAEEQQANREKLREILAKLQGRGGNGTLEVPR
jgi:hypothetical protein